MTKPAKPVVVEVSRAVPVAVDKAFTDTLPIPLTQICSHWYGPIPPIKQVRDQTGDWTAAGQTRTIVLAGGGCLDEELTSVDPPRSFGYTLSRIKGPMAPLVSQVEGLWSFVPNGSETTITWQWTMHPRSGLSAPLVPLLGRLWQGYARITLGKLAAALTA